MRPEHLATPDAFARFLGGFEAGTLPKAEWTHGAHVAAAASYLHGSNFETVLPLMRQRISAYNLAVGGANTPTSGYHETLTRFWLLVIAALLDERQPRTPLEAAQIAVSVFGEERSLHNRYYSWDVVKDSASRLGWRAPDLIPMAGAEHPLD